MHRSRVQRSFLIAGLLLLAMTGVRGQSAGQTAPDLYVLSIGVGEYHNYGSRDPRFATKDAKDIAAAVANIAKNRFANVHTELLLNEQATQAGIAAAMRRIIRSARAQDTFIFFYSGHGRSLESKRLGSQFYLIPSGFDVRQDQLETKAISASLLQTWFMQVECAHQFVAFDSSKSTGGFQDFKTEIDRENKRLAGLNRRDMVVISIRQWSFEFANMQNGLLTYVLLHGLGGGAAMATGDIDAGSLARYVNEQLPVVLKKNANAKARAIMRGYPGSGRPFVYFSGEDFPLGALGGESRASGARPGGPSAIGDHDPISYPASAKRDTYKQNPKCIYRSQPSTVAGDRKGKDRALLIAGDNYERWDRLVNPVFDAETLAGLLHERYNFETEVLENPDNDCFDDAADRYAAKEYAADSQLFIFYAGHGAYLDRRQDGFIIPRDARSEDDDLWGRSFLSHSLFRKMIDGVRCNHILLVMDACQSGSIGDDDRGGASAPEQACADASMFRGSTEDDFIGRLLSCKTRQFITSGDREYVPDGVRGKHSPFASQLLEALGRDSGGHSFVSINELYPIIQRVPGILPRHGYWGDDRGRGDFLFFLH